MTDPISASGMTFNASSSGNYTITGGTLNLTDIFSAANVTTNANATIASQINAAGGLTKSGTGILNLQATANGQTNTLSGAITINAGTLVLGGGANTFATDGAMGGNITVSNGGTLKLGQSEVISNQSVITVNSGGVFNLNGFSETVNSLVGNGSVILSAGQKLVVSLPDSLTSNGSFSGIISGAGGAPAWRQYYIRRLHPQREQHLYRTDHHRERHSDQPRRKYCVYREWRCSQPDRRLHQCLGQSAV